MDRFTERAQRVMALGQEEARRLNHNYIGTEHLLLALVREGDGIAARVLASLGVDLAQVREAVIHVIGRGDRMVVGEVGITPRVKRVLELAADEARRMSHQFIGTEHLLLGLVREGDGIGADILRKMGITPDKARAATLALLERTAPGALDRQDQAPPIPAEASALVDAGADAPTCPRCGARLPAHFRYCFNCGEALAVREE